MGQNESELQTDPKSTYNGCGQPLHVEGAGRLPLVLPIGVYQLHIVVAPQNGLALDVCRIGLFAGAE